MTFDFGLQPESAMLLRAMAAFACCLATGLLTWPWAIAWLSRYFREPIKSISPTVMRLHQHKAQTPTMGGIFIVAAIALGSLLFANLADALVISCLLAMLGFALLGFIDDLTKLKTSRRGLSATSKLIGQLFLAIPIAVALGYVRAELSVLYLTKYIFTLLIAANAVNLTDGLDGLAGGCGLVASLAIAAVFVLSGSELGIVSAALAGALGAFLAYNRFPARVFMGDTGSQAIGSVLGVLAICEGGSVWLVLVCGVFLAEIASVVLQLASYRIRNKRLFLCAPLHHHFQFAGWSEPQIVRLFWGTALTFAVVAVTFASPIPRPPLANRKSFGSENLSARTRVPELQADRGARSSIARLAKLEFHESSHP